MEIRLWHFVKSPWKIKVTAERTDQCTPTEVLDKMTFSHAIHLLPVLWPALICVTVFTPYIIAVLLHHVYPLLPSISKNAAFEPEGSIFGFLMTFVAFFGLLIIFCRYLQLERIQGDCEQNVLQKVKWFNKVSLPFGFLCILSVVVVANFRIPALNVVSLFYLFSDCSALLHWQLYLSTHKWDRFRQDFGTAPYINTAT